MAARVAEVLVIAALATVVTAAISVTVLRAPGERVFGEAIVGRHHDPFTVMAQFDGAPVPAIYWQPFTDGPGRLIARLTGGIAAYNWVVLLSFPLAAISAFLLARYLLISPAGAALAAMAYAFAPFHIAHAAYHPQVAQVQWMPLYLLALWRCLDRPSVSAALLLVASAAAVALSNFYGGLIAAIVTPVAVIAYSASNRRSPRVWRDMGITLGVLASAGAAGLGYAFAFAPALFANRAAFAFPAADVVRYSAAAVSFVTPPVAHPVWGDAVLRAFDAAGARNGMLEQQVFLGWSLIALALIAVGHWLTHRGEHPRVPVLMSVGAVALFFAIWPPAWLYHALPMFRSYARFGVVVQLMTALAAGMGFDVLRRRSRRSWRVVAATCAVMLAGEYAVSPAAMSRDVLPTLAHRWAANRAEPTRALDCVPQTLESQSIPSLSKGRVEIAGAGTDCFEPEFERKLAAGGYTHLLVRVGRAGDPRFRSARTAPGLSIAAAFPDSEVFRVTSAAPAIYTSTVTGFSPREQDMSWSWRWMGRLPTWTVRNTSAATIVASLDLELSAFHNPRNLDVELDGRRVAALEIDPERRPYNIGPFAMSPGDHVLTFRAVEPSTVANTLLNNGDRRALSFAIGAWHWSGEVAK